MRTLALAVLTLAAIATAQNYRCDWSVNGIGGGEMSSSDCKCGATAGQPASGLMTGPHYRVFIGYWLTEGQAGVSEQESRSGGALRATRLDAPQPNPFRAHATIRYSLSATTRASVQVHDLTGRVVRTLVNGARNSGLYSVRWDGRDDRGRLLSNGVYFCRFRAGSYSSDQKLVMAR